MPDKSNKKLSLAIQARVRIVRGDDIAIGPGKAELLAFIRETGSIAEAARRMGMSYMRAWMLIKTMNRCFKKPLIRAARGGKEGGGAALTETGKTALALYQQMGADSLRAAQSRWQKIKVLLRE